MSIEKTDFENIKVQLAAAIRGEAAPSFREAESTALIRACGALAASGNTGLLALLGIFALARLVEHQGASAIAERELALLLPTLKNQ